MAKTRRFPFHEVSGGRVIRMPQNLTSELEEPLLRTIDPWTADVAPAIFLDFTDSTWIESPGAGVLLRALKLAQDRGQQLVFVGTSGQVRLVLDRIRFGLKVRMISRIEEAQEGA